MREIAKRLPKKADGGVADYTPANGVKYPEHDFSQPLKTVAQLAKMAPQQLRRLVAQDTGIARAQKRVGPLERGLADEIERVLRDETVALEVVFHFYLGGDGSKIVIGRH